MNDSPRPERDEGLEIAAAAGVHQLAIPTPFQVGRVNAYLIEDSPLTLVDSGPNSAKALDELEQSLAGLGHRIEDIELLIITHQHLDHFGLAAILARRSGAEVAALDRLAPLLARYGVETDLDDRFAETMMLRHGIPPEIVTALRSVSASFRGWGAAVEVTRPLADGSDIELAGRTLRVLHRPGPQPLGHGLPRSGALDAARRRSSDRAHLIQPAARPSARQPRGVHRARAPRRSSPTWTRSR